MRSLLLGAAVALAAVAAAAQGEPEVSPAVTTAAEAGRTRLEVRLVTAPGIQVASYQGELRLPAGTAAVASLDFPAGVVGAWNEAEPGRIRFAAVSAQGLGAVPALVMRVPGTVDARTVSVVLEEAVGADGFRKLVVGRPAQNQPRENR